MYPNKYFRPAQWAADPDDSVLGRLSYQYGLGAHSQAFMLFPAAAAFNAAPPFDFFRISDGAGPFWTFTFRPDLAPVAPIVTGRNVQLNIQGRTAIQIAGDVKDAFDAVSAGSFPTGAGGALMTWAEQHNAPNNNQLTVTQMQIGIQGILDQSGMTVVGFAASAFLPSTGGGLLAGRTRATGYILPVDGAGLVDTETLTIIAPDESTPGSTITVVFEFDSGAGVTPPRTAIPFTALDTIQTVMTSIINTINNSAAPPAGRGPFFGVRASQGPGALIFLRATVPGSVGGGIFNPNLMSETVANIAFAVVGMSGGQDGSMLAPLRWGLSRGMMPIAGGFEVEQGEG